MNKTIFFAGLAIILLEVIGLGGYILAQQSQEFLKSLVLVIIVSGLNLAAVIMMLVGLFKE
jgi:hypothetical protein